jgi:hypothetical protein
MNNEKMKRINVTSGLYADAVQIGKAQADGEKAAENGVAVAVKYYLETSHVDLDTYQNLLKFQGVDKSILNNMEAIQALAKNANLSDDEVSLKINNSLKSVITEIMEIH